MRSDAYWWWSIPTATPSRSELSQPGKPTGGKGNNMKRAAAEPRRRIDFSGAKRGAVASPQPGKTKISIRLDNEVLDHFRALVDAAGGGNYQSLINDALRTLIRQQSAVDVTRHVVKQEIEMTLRRVLREEAAAYNVEERTRAKGRSVRKQ